jgi:hypothetical protein
MTRFLLMLPWLLFVLVVATTLFGQVPYFPDLLFHLSKLGQR